MSFNRETKAKVIAAELELGKGSNNTRDSGDIIRGRGEQKVVLQGLQMRGGCVYITT